MNFRPTILRERKRENRKGYVLCVQTVVINKNELKRKSKIII